MDHIYWVIDNVLAGRPGPSFAPWNADELAHGGIGGIVSLSGNVSTATLQKAGIEHLQIDDQLPFQEAAQRDWFNAVLPQVLGLIERVRDVGAATLVHCHHGLDRTGVVLGCCLMALMKVSAAESIDRVRRANQLALREGAHRDAMAHFGRLHRL